MNYCITLIRAPARPPQADTPRLKPGSSGAASHWPGRNGLTARYHSAGRRDEVSEAAGTEQDGISSSSQHSHAASSKEVHSVSGGKSSSPGHSHAASWKGVLMSPGGGRREPPSGRPDPGGRREPFAGIPDF